MEVAPHVFYEMTVAQQLLTQPHHKSNGKCFKTILFTEQCQYLW